MRNQFDVETYLQLIQSGRRDALGVLLDHYRPRLLQLVSLYKDARINARAESGDVLQEVYLDAANQIDTYLRQRGVDFYVWLRGITMQRLAKLHRFHVNAKCRSVSRELSLPDQSSVMLAKRLTANLSTPSEHLRKQEMRTCVQGALQGLSESDRQLILMRHFEGLGNREVAQSLGVKESAAATRYGRALGRLREALLTTLQSGESR